MILVTLGTQDKPFTRLLKALDTLVEKGKIKDDIIVQAGCTKYESKNMKIFDYFSQEEFEQLVKKCDLLITHAGVGSIMTGLRYDKKIIAVPRSKKYGEHTNDHQKQIAGEFAKLGYILELKDFTQLGKLVEKANTFQPKKHVTDPSGIIDTIEAFIEENERGRKQEGMIRKYWNKYKEVIMYLIFGVLTTVVNIVTYGLLTRLFHMDEYISNMIAWIISVSFAFITNKLFVFESKDRKVGIILKESISFFGFRLLSLGFDMGAMYLMISVLKWDDLIAKIISNIIVIVLNYIFSKLFIFRKKH